MQSADNRCDHWVSVADHRCRNYWRREVVLDQDTQVSGSSMFGTYAAGVWHFCNIHYRIFKRNRTEDHAVS